MEYNDEILCPELYSKMAEEYQKNLNKNNDKNTLNNLLCYFDEFNNYLVFLNSLKKININNKKFLEIINQKFLNIKSEYTEINNFNFTNKNINSNYCECLTKCISICTVCIKNIYNKKHFSLIKELCEITENLSYMYGYCKYRK